MRSYTITIALIAGASFAVAAPHRYHLLPNREIRVLAIAEAPDGRLWIGAFDGLYRVEGGRLHKVEDYPARHARFLGFTRDGALWVGGSEGLLRRQERFEFITRDSVGSMVVLPERVLFKTDRLASIGLDRRVTYFDANARGDLLPAADGSVWFVDEIAAARLTPGLRVERFGNLANFLHVVRDGRGRLWAATDTRAEAVGGARPGGELRRAPPGRLQRSGPLVPGRNGQLWFVGERVRGLHPEIEFADRALNDRYPPTAAYEDARGHLWVARQGLGLVEWIPDAEWQRWYPEEFDSEAPVQAARNAAGRMVVATTRGLFEQRDGRWQPLGSHRFWCVAFLPLPRGGYLIVLEAHAIQELGAAGHLRRSISSPGLEQQTYHQLLRDSAGTFWAAGTSHVLRIEPAGIGWNVGLQPLPDLPSAPALVTLALDTDGRIWASYAGRLARIGPDGRWLSVVVRGPQPSAQSLAVRSPEELVLSPEMGGLLKGTRRGGHWEMSVQPDEGQKAEEAPFLARDSRGWLWRGSSAGVYVAKGGPLDPLHWIHLGPRNGLATGFTQLMSFFEDRDGSVWIAGEEGLTRLRPRPEWFAAPATRHPPRVLRMELNGKEIRAVGEIDVPRDATVRLEIDPLGGAEFRDDPVIYRVDSAAWQPARGGMVELKELPAGAHELELSWAGEGSSPREVVRLRVPAPLSPWYPIGGLGALLALAVWQWEGLRYRAGKGWFLLGRRWRRRDSLTRDRSGDRLLGRYELLRPLSCGGFSVVYEARDVQREGFRVAVKILNASEGQEGSMRDQFLQEVAALRSVEHEGVVSVLDSWVEPTGEPCLAMPFLDGPTLRTVLGAGVLPRERASRLALRLGSALQAVHERGVVHRDIKPENIVVLHAGTLDEQPVLIDFGTAGLRAGGDGLALTTLLGGSLAYLAPERLGGYYSTASDLYSFAVVVLEMLTGKRPAELGVVFAEGETTGRLAQCLEDVGAGPVTELLIAALHPNPARRPSRVADWAREVAVALNQR